MIEATITPLGYPAVISDKWHILRATWDGNLEGKPRFLRVIVSEHQDRTEAVRAAREFITQSAGLLATVPMHRRDQILVRRPGYRSLQRTFRVVRKGK